MRNQKLHAVVARSRFGSQKTNYTSRDPKQQQRMFPQRSCAIQNSWNCLADSCLLFYSFITSIVQIRGNPKKKGEEGRQAPEPQTEAGGTRKSMMEQSPFPEKRKKREEGRQAPELPPERRGTRKSMMKQNPFPEERKKREEGRQAPEPEPEPGGTSKS